MRALFGAFLAGLIVPAGTDLESRVIARVEPITMAVLLPVFFAFTGLRTNVRLLDNGTMWRDALLLLTVAVAGKGGASTIAARAMGIRWREAAALGALLNTQGLIELVILNIGAERGILSPAVYAIMVLIALFTTVMTSPILTALRLGSEGPR